MEMQMVDDVCSNREMSLSVVIVGYKSGRKLEACLESLSSVASSLNLEVVVVNNCVGDTSLDPFKSRYPTFKIVENVVNGGFANGCNFGASHSSGDLLLFLNPDTRVNVEAMEAFLRALREMSDNVILSCKQVKSDGSESVAYGIFPGVWNITGFQRMLRNIFCGKPTFVRSDDGSMMYPDWISGSVVLMKRSFYEALGGFDEDFWMYYEDVDLCRRATTMGAKIVLLNDVTIIHDHGASSRRTVKTTALTKTEVIISQHLYVSKHVDGFQRVVVEAFLVTSNLLRSIIVGAVGLPLFFCKPLFVRSLVCARLMVYYMKSMLRGTWVSERSVRYNDLVKNK